MQYQKLKIKKKMKSKYNIIKTIQQNFLNSFFFNKSELRKYMNENKNGQVIQNRSKLKRRCKYRGGKSFLNQRGSQKPRQILSQLLEVDYARQIKPQQIKVHQIETYQAFTQQQIKNIFNRQITRQILQRIIIDAMKLCYLYNPIMQAIQTQLTYKKYQFKFKDQYKAKQEYKVKDILSLLISGSFYQFLILKTQPTKFLINNRTTQINVKTIISGILAIIGGRLTIQNLSDVILFYRLQQALYQTSPNGLPFEFEKIIKAMKKIDRYITADKFTKWQRKINQLQSNINYLQPYHFVYLMSLSEPMSKKKNNIFEVDRKQSSKYDKQSQMINIIKQKNNFIDSQKRKLNWRNEIKVRGLSFQQGSRIRQVQQKNKQFEIMRKKIKSHRRIKSAYIKSEAIQMVRKDIKKNNLKQNQYLLNSIIQNKGQANNMNKENDRKLLKKHNKICLKIRQYEKHESEQHCYFKHKYQEQLQNKINEYSQFKEYKQNEQNRQEDNNINSQINKQNNKQNINCNKNQNKQTKQNNQLNNKNKQNKKKQIINVYKLDKQNNYQKNKQKQQKYKYNQRQQNKSNKSQANKLNKQQKVKQNRLQKYKQNRQQKQQQQIKGDVIRIRQILQQDQQFIDIYSHHLTRILANVKSIQFYLDDHPNSQNSHTKLLKYL